MIPPDIRIHTRTRFTLFALVALSALIMFSLLARDARAAGATSADLTLAGGTLVVSPTNLTNCRQCTVTVSNESPNRSLTWFAVSRGIPGVMVNPQGGTLQRKGRVSVTITLPSNITCPANDTISFFGSGNSVNVSWSCLATPTPTPSPTTPTPTPTPTSAPTQLPTPTTAIGPTQTASSPGPTPTATSVLNGSGQRNEGNPPATGGSQGSSALSILLSVAALALALLAFALYLMQPAKTSLRMLLLSLILPTWLLRKLDQNR